MELNWFTVIAQIINFWILVWLLKRFLYKPILKAMEDRQNYLTGLEEELQGKEQLAQENICYYGQMMEKLEKERLDILAHAQVEAEEKRLLLVSDSRAEIVQIKKQWEESLKREQSTFLKDGQSLIGKEAIRIAGAVLRDLADAELEELMLKHFIKKVDSLSDENLSKLRLGIKQNNNRVVLNSAFEVKLSRREGIRTALSNKLGQDINIEYEVNKLTGAGIEVDAGGYHLGWSIEDYLHELNDKLRRYFDNNSTRAEV